MTPSPNPLVERIAAASALAAEDEDSKDEIGRELAERDRVAALPEDFVDADHD